MVARSVLRVWGCRKRYANERAPAVVIRRTSPACRRSAISSRPLRGGFVRHSASVKIWRTAVPFAEKSSVLGTHWGRKIADCNGTQPNVAGRKILIKRGLGRCKAVRLNPVEYG